MARLSTREKRKHNTAMAKATSKIPMLPDVIWERVHRAADLIVDGFAQRKVADMLSREYGVAIPAAKGYITTARQEMQRRATQTSEQQFAVSMARMEKMFRKAMQNDNLRTALEVEKARINLLGLEPPKEMFIHKTLKATQMNFVLDLNAIGDLNDEQKRALMGALEQLAPEQDGEPMGLLSDTIDVEYEVDDIPDAVDDVDFEE